MAEARAPEKLVREKRGYSDRNEKALKKKTFHPVQVIAVTSGKGGVGKTNVVANLAYSLRLLKQRVLILDADMGLANLDVLLGLIPKYTIQHILLGERTLEQIMIDGPEGMKILPASLGIQELTELTAQQRMALLSQLELLNECTDVLLIDTASGISSNVMFFNTMANEIIISVSPEPTSITAAYAMIKVLAARYAGKCFHLLVNFVRGEEEGLEVYRQLSMLTEGSLNLSIHYLGSIPTDAHVQKAVKQQRVVTELYPSCPASRSFLSLAKKIIHLPVPSMPRGNLNLFWRSLLGKSIDHQEDTISL
ncbi:MAG: AAA family ATPase [Proteobacteria bacterium]|nr:AAA family ATPase [Pseudomonadota bacterium]NIS68135.1 AAA family ATPase [Pseudomonadota bacterium]